MSVYRLLELEYADEVVPATVYAVYKDGRMKPIWSGLIRPDRLGKAVSSSPVGSVGGSTGSSGHADDSGSVVLAGTSDSSVTVVAGADYVSTGPQDPPTGNPPSIDNSDATAQSCKIEVSFTGSYDGNLNGPSTADSKNKGSFHGIGFSVKISGLSGDVALRSAPDHPKPKNTWLVEQWVADFNFRNGDVVRQDVAARMDNLAAAYPVPRRDGDSVSWYDHPGTSAAGTLSYFTKRNFYIKAYNGKRHCEVALHLTFRVFRGQILDARWGSGLYR